MEFHQTWLEEAINWLDFEWDGGGGGGAVRAPAPPPPPPPHPILFIYATFGILSDLVGRSSTTWQLTN